ncbi:MULTISPECIES: 3D domain-containing protein [Bacillota]|uniref:3D domain-containing protein n=1 Tax=Bacillota TaxID=1239 RepID=UPI00211203B5|nr:3D domain-containing protein [Eubacterium sp. AF05-24]
MDTNIIPYGTRVMINNHIYTAEDCGGAVKGNVIDIYTTTPKDVTYNTEVFVLMK